MKNLLFLAIYHCFVISSCEIGLSWWSEQTFQQVIDFKRRPGIILAGCYIGNESPSIN